MGVGFARAQCPLWAPDFQLCSAPSSFPLGVRPLDMFVPMCGAHLKSCLPAAPPSIHLLLSGKSGSHLLGSDFILVCRLSLLLSLFLGPKSCPEHGISIGYLNLPLRRASQCLFEFWCLSFSAFLHLMDQLHLGTCQNNSLNQPVKRYLYF